MKKRQQGFSIISAIFLIVVLAFLGIAMVSFSTSQHESSAMDVMGTRAYQAAKAGIEWGAYQVLPNSAAAFATACRLGPVSSPVAVPVDSTVSGFNIQVDCHSSAHSDVSAAGGLVRIYEITSTANRGVAGQLGFVERQMRVSISQ